MASSPKFVCLFFLLTTLLFSLQTYARDSHFFSKVSRNRDEDASTPNTNKFFMNNKVNDEFVPLNKQEEPQEQPTFIPQTTETGYGLYGHETGLDPPSTTTTTTSLYNMDENNNNNNNNKFDSFNNYFKNNNEDHHEKNYVPELKGLSTSNEAPSKFINNNNNNFNNNNFNDEGNYYDANKNDKYSYNGINSEERYVPNKNNNNEEGNKYYGARRYNGMNEKQGMSDTRFLENGKYYYDLNNEENYGLNNNNHMSNSNKYNNNYETNGYYGNKEANYESNYFNNNNLYRENGMKGYQSRIPEDERFDFDDQP